MQSELGTSEQASGKMCTDSDSVESGEYSSLLFYGDDVAYLEMNNDDPNGFWDCMVNRLESYRVFVEDMVQDLEQLYTDTMTAFAIRSLMEGKAADAQRIYDGVCVPEQQNLLREWYRTDSAHRPLVLQRFVEKISKLNMAWNMTSPPGRSSCSPPSNPWWTQPISALPDLWR